MLSALVKMLRNTHRHPLNRTLHAVGLPLYVYGIALVVSSYLNGEGTNIFLGLGLWAMAVTMLLLGHSIEGNIMSMTPVLVGRLVLRSFRQFDKKSIHLFR